MPTTTNYGFYSPPLTGVTPNVPRDTKTLADAVDVALKAEETARIAADAKIGTPSVDVIANAVQSLANATEVTITYNTAISNPDGMWSSGGNITIPTGGGGLYAINLGFSYAGNATGARIVLIKVNGTTVRSWTVTTGSAAAFTGMLPYWRRLSAADVVTMALYQSSGGSLNTFNQSYPSIQMYRAGI